MSFKWITALYFGLILSIICSPIHGRLHFQQLSATEVYNRLREAGRLDAVPEGRIVTQGIAAATGFVAGIVKGAGIPLLLSLALGNSTSGTTGGTITQEICFSSRSLNEIDDDDIEEAEGRVIEDDEPQGRQTPPTGTTTAPAPAPAPPPPPPPPTPPPTTTATATPTTTTGTGTGTTSPTTATTVTSPTTTGTQTGTATGTTTDTGTGTGTNTATTTNTGTGGAVNCIVIQKPV